MSPKRVFILGAGFSKQAGMPLATELTPLLRRKFEEYDHTEALEWFASLDERISWIKHTDKNAVLTPNIEELFDFAYFDALIWKMWQQLCPLGRDSGDTPYSTAEAIEAWLSYMEDDLIEIIWDQQQTGIEKDDGISRFAAILRENDTIVTFNYDTLIEQSISQAKRPWQYGFNREEGKGIPILKMHGSINWAVVPRDQVDAFGYPVLFQKGDKNVKGASDEPTGQPEYDNVLLRILDDKLANRIKCRSLQWSNKQYSIGMGGLGRYKPLDRIPGSGQVWHKAGRALYQTDEIYIVGFSLSPFDTMARLHFAGVMCERAKKKNAPPKIVLIDPNACKLKAEFHAVFGVDTIITIYQKKAEQVKWSEVLGDAD
ncbi:MAG: SIR2 family protein [Sedimentisphaerales bacterium]